MTCLTSVTAGQGIVKTAKSVNSLVASIVTAGPAAAMSCGFPINNLYFFLSRQLKGDKYRLVVIADESKKQAEGRLKRFLDGHNEDFDSYSIIKMMRTVPETNKIVLDKIIE